MTFSPTTTPLMFVWVFFRMELSSLIVVEAETLEWDVLVNSTQSEWG